jgi:hypothetical protein
MSASTEILIAVDKCVKYFKIENIEIDIADPDEDSVRIEFPREAGGITYDADDFIFYVNALEGVKFTKKSVRARNVSQYPIFSNEIIDYPTEGTIFYFENDLYTIKIIENPFLLGLANVKLDLYSKYAPPCSTYYAVEITYKTEQKLDEAEEIEVIKSFVFEYYMATNVLLEIVELHDFDSDYYGDFDEDADDKKSIVVNTLIEHNDALDSYLKAVNTKDDEIKFLYYYKIIEFFSPKIAKLKAYEILSKKLDSLKYQNSNNEDLNKIFEISESFKKSKSDSELSKTVLSNSVDIIDLFSSLPENVSKLICRNAKLNPKDINYSLSQESIDSIFQQLGKVIYSTRNNIVHAKSNYSRDGFECSEGDLYQLNLFLSKATYQIIRWNDKLPK